MSQFGTVDPSSAPAARRHELLESIKSEIGNLMTSELERNLLNADCHTVSLVHSLVLCSEFITHAFSVASRYVNFDQRIVRKMCLACEFGVVKGVAAFDDVISTLPTELQPHNLHPNYFTVMGATFLTS